MKPTTCWRIRRKERNMMSWVRTIIPISSRTERKDLIGLNGLIRVREGSIRTHLQEVKILVRVTFLIFLKTFLGIQPVEEEEAEQGLPKEVITMQNLLLRWMKPIRVPLKNLA